MKALVLLLLAIGGRVRPGMSQTLAEQARAVIEQRCLSCHGEQVAMSGLRMLTREQILQGGGRGPAVKPGDPANSLLFKTLSHGEKLAMPPTGKLAFDEIEILRAWIEKGADWPQGKRQAVNSQWWAFSKPRCPEVPKIPGVKNPVDAFVSQRLKAIGLEPVVEADKLTLLRRACFDLHGLPPSPEQSKAFLNDTTPQAWERLIDSLLASPRYGEKWARHWLDLVRYGDTSGFEQDPYTLEAWRYRDYVIKSFNDDKPYDRFVKEQIAGDQLWPEDAEART
jgi:hypothetical protein